MEVQVLRCPNCGANLDRQDKTCKYCDSPVVITSLKDIASFSPIDTNKYVRAYNNMDIEDSAELQFSLAMCFLKLKQYDKAKNALNNILDNSMGFADVYFYLAIATMQGKKPFVHLRGEIDEMESYLQSALSLEDKAVYYYMMAYIRYDYHKRKWFNLPEEERYEVYDYLATECGMTDYDKDLFFEMIGQDRPDTI